MAKPGGDGLSVRPDREDLGFRDASFGGKEFKFQRPYGSYVIENILFKVAFPAEFHAQTAVEASIMTREILIKSGRTTEEIKRVTIRTHAACLRIIDKKGPLVNAADRDHCIQYMVAVSLIFGRLTAADYEDNLASDLRIDALREKIVCLEDPQLTVDYHDPQKRSIANGLIVEFQDGNKLDEIAIEYPLGHKRRRAEGIPLLEEKFKTNLGRRFPAKQQKAILKASLDQKALEAMPVNEYVDLFVI